MKLRSGQGVRSRSTDLPKDVRHRTQGDGIATEVHAAAEEKGDTAPGRTLVDQPRLADAGVSTDEEQGRHSASCVRNGPLERFELLGAPYKPSALMPIRNDAVQYPR